jgi:acetyl esterase/lipase
MIKTYRFIIAVLLICFGAGLLGCNEDWDVVTIYKNDTQSPMHYHTVALKLPDNLTGAPYPAIVFIHGGWYVSGDYNQFYNECQDAAERGYIAISIDYHLTPYLGNTSGRVWPEQLSDARKAVEWLRSNQSIYFNGRYYNLNQIVKSDAIGVAGLSAGAHTALMVGLTNSTMNNPYYHYNALGDVQAVCSLAGATHYLSEYFESKDEYSSPKDYIMSLLNPDPVLSIVGNLGPDCDFEHDHYCNYETGTSIQEVVPSASPHPYGLFAYASPYYQSSPGTSIYNDAPILMVIGADDRTVPYASQHVPFFNKLKGPKQEVVFCRDGSLGCVCGHSFTYHTAERNDQMFRFFDQHLKQ